MKKDFIFTTQEENAFGVDALITAGRVLNTSNVLNGIIFNTILSTDYQLATIGMASISNTPIMYKNLHGLDIDTTLLDGYTLFETGKVKAANQDGSEEVETSFMIAVEFTTIPAIEIPAGQEVPEGYVKDDSVGMNLRIALPKGVVEYCRAHNINHGNLYMQIAGKVGEVMSNEFMTRYLNTETSTVIGGSEEHGF